MGATGITAADGTEVFYSDIHAALEEYLRDRQVEDMSKEPQSKWNAALIYIYNTVFKGTNILKADNYSTGNLVLNNPSNNNAYDLDKVNSICDIYINLCYEYDKEISIMGFSKLTGINQDTFYDWGNGSSRLGSLGSEIYKKLKAEREESLSNMLITGRRNPVGVLGVLNHSYNWNMPGVREQTNKPALSASELPVLELNENNTQLGLPEVGK